MKKRITRGELERMQNDSNKSVQQQSAVESMEVDNTVAGTGSGGDTSDDDVFTDDQGGKIEDLLDSDDDSGKAGKSKTEIRGTKRPSWY
jgi:hypothetical protein